MPYYDNPGQINDEAINIVGGRSFNVVQLANASGEVIDPSTGTLVFEGTVEVPAEIAAEVPARVPTTASVASSASSVTILAANANRKGLSISNISTSKLYLSYTSPASVSNCFIEMAPGAFLLLDQQLIVANAIYGIWDSANGAAQVTEYV